MTPWEHATLALRLLAIDPNGLGGMVIRSRLSPARDALMSAAAALPMAAVKLQPHMTSQTLDGDIDLSATLREGTLVTEKGLLHRGPSLFILPMAERVSPYLCARLSQALDRDESHTLLALDEGSDEDECVPPALADRVAFRVDLDGLALADLDAVVLPYDPQGMRKMARKVAYDADLPLELVTLAMRLGISSLRAPTFALRAAQAHAALKHRNTLTPDDVTAAVALVFAHRATCLPDAETAMDPPPPERTESTEPATEEQSMPDDVLLDAVKAALPPDILAKLGKGATRSAKGSGAGAKRAGNRRGRPLPARAGSKTGSARVDLVATLRAAIPWQTLRKRALSPKTGPTIRSSDLRYKRYQSLSDRLLIFAVDASGSAAMARLAEAKGAVEILLSEAYARRDHVALISFRGSQAEVLLPPTRSLVQTKRRLAAIPGGGATPLASGLTAAHTLAQQAVQKGLTPTIVLLTDGRANVGLDGQANRSQAKQDAQQIAASISITDTDALVIDTTNRPEPSLQELANILRATYIPLPRADAHKVSKAVTASLAG